MPEAPFDIARANRWFAVELNNRTWDMVEATERNAQDSELMIHAAHAACYHWLQAGDLLNHLRAQCLLATAYTAAGHAEAALRHATRCLDLSQLAGDEQTPWDRAITYGCAAQAFASAGQTVEATALQTQAQEAADALTDPADREYFDRIWGGGESHEA